MIAKWVWDETTEILRHLSHTHTNHISGSHISTQTCCANVLMPGFGRTTVHTNMINGWKESLLSVKYMAMTVHCPISIEELFRRQHQLLNQILPLKTMFYYRPVYCWRCCLSNPCTVHIIERKSPREAGWFCRFNRHQPRLSYPVIWANYFKWMWSRIERESVMFHCIIRPCIMCVCYSCIAMPDTSYIAHSYELHREI